MAEALLRVIKFKDERVALCSVSLTLEDPDPKAHGMRYHSEVAKPFDAEEEMGTGRRNARLSENVSLGKDMDGSSTFASSDVVQRPNGLRLLQCSPQLSAITTNCLDLCDLAFTVVWHRSVSENVFRITIQETRDMIERSIEREFNKGLQCLGIAWQELAGMSPKPFHVALTVQGRPYTTLNLTEESVVASGVMTVALQTTKFDATQPEILMAFSKLFAVRLIPRTDVTTINVRFFGVSGFAEGPFSASEIRETVKDIISNLNISRNHLDLRSLTNLVASTLRTHRKRIARDFDFNDVDLTANISGERQESFRASSTPHSSTAEIESGPAPDSLHDGTHKTLQSDEVVSGAASNDGSIDFEDESTGHASVSDRQTQTDGEGREGVSAEIPLFEISANDVPLSATHEGGAKEASSITPPRDRFHQTPTLIAIGSNVGDRLACIEESCRALHAQPGIRIVKTSALYETEAMYVEDQDPFLNGVCKIETSLSPMELLDRTQAIEQQLGRVKTIDKGPRNIDLDILLHGSTSMKSDRLTLPHPLMLERHFVLQPMHDVIQMKRVWHPVTGKHFRHHSKQLGEPKTPMHALTPLGAGCPDLRPNDIRRATHVMSILNVTPDSFSDGGENTASGTDGLRDLIRSHIAGGATIIDVGGQSSRPNAPDVSVEEEIDRVLPAIEAIKSLPEAAGIAISIDTYRAAVAEAAINAGAHIVNDISAGCLDDDMLPTVAKLGCTYIMMHMRGTPATMMDAENCEYPEGLVPTIARELSHRVEAAQRAGIRHWRIILDPGIGFSKTAAQNVRLMSAWPELCRWFGLRSYPWLVGTSRKSFIGKITGVAEPKGRIWGTTATVTAAVQGGADIVRVHDVLEMAQVVKMADAVYRVKEV